MKRVINLDNWNRKEHFKFFSALDDPFWGITTTVDFTSIYQQSKNMEVSFFLYSVHFLLKCINATTAFKLRIENGEVVEYDKINIFCFRCNFYYLLYDKKIRQKKYSGE